MSMQIDAVALQGFNLVEASAGTGKTHTLTSLYLRLLLEQGYGPEQILVVTYTKAATAELKTRIRQRLLEARSHFDGAGSADLLLQAIHDKLVDRERARHQIDLAIANFDRAAIFTIHGFCQRVLSEQAFETGQGFNTTLVPDQSDRLLQIADDFWRREINRLPDRLLQALRLWIDRPETLLQRMRPALGKPYLKVRGCDWPQGIALLEQQAIELQSEVLALWQDERDTILALLSDNQVMRGNLYRKAWLEGWGAKMDQWLQATPFERPFDKAERFVPESIEAAAKPGMSAPQHPFFPLFARYLRSAEGCANALDKAMVALQESFYDYLLRELPRRQGEAGEWSYDDLLLQLHSALQGAGSGHLAALLRRRYPAALVDEFQDTDPIQYAILSRIYHDSRQPVFLVGDPKQAIYSFRGADLFAYLRAREETGAKHHSLDINWRSTPGLVRAVNTLFGRAHRPFYEPRIGFESVAAADREMDPLVLDNEPDAPLQIWRIAFDDQAGVEAIRQAVADATAAEIARLLTLGSQNRARIGERQLCGSDIAVLVRTHEQASRIAQALRVHGIAAVHSSQQSIYWTREAEHLQRLLIALLEPHRGPLVRAALATPMLGWDGAAIDELNREDGSQNRLFKRFFDYHRSWRDDGFIAMIKALVMEMDIENRLLEFADGERRLTNFYHLLELLHQHDTTAHPGMEGLSKWFFRQCQSTSQDDERLLRLESDGQLVKIDTLHHSKGLEYEIVFCPYPWDESEPKADDRPYLFHDPLDDYAAVLELGSDQFLDNRDYFHEEEFAESLRLLYVALTRPRYRCYLAWGWMKQSRHSALGWLLRNSSDADSTQDLATWRKRAKQLDPGQDAEVLQALGRAAGGAIDITPLPRDKEVAQLALPLPHELQPARRFTTTISAVGNVASFSSLVAGQHEDRPDHDASSALRDRMQDQLEGFSVHGFPRGSRPGSCLHAILEELDFTRGGGKESEALVEQQLLLHAIDTRWTTLVAEWMNKILETPLNGAGLTLSRISGEQRLNEMAFYFPARSLRTKTMLALAEEHRFAGVDGLIDGLASLRAGVVDGYVKGYIDLVFEADGCFYLADYKSNWLGNSYADYHPQALRTAMVEHRYTLQYLLYTLALHRYLKLRLPGYDYERHFGGVYYLFLRGMQPQSGARLGVVAERPSEAFIEALDRMIEAHSDGSS
ncbi:MAG: exodeoxyribonuclease V subunit beta [Candidatus Thiodiazotropha sp. (ex Ctena orbiculata)]|uniref:RecBCD enzyme subunit RecB n=1 Tax=Candidatus Thiodiazotropha taylori TaxID=2792791 RepID=A0A944ME94_9GAMM|nr:exodeoxyribonuclease V subunit beta [Candidatus Thiodiazotropha taylori]